MSSIRHENCKVNCIYFYIVSLLIRVAYAVVQDELFVLRRTWRLFFSPSTNIISFLHERILCANNFLLFLIAEEIIEFVYRNRKCCTRINENKRERNTTLKVGSAVLDIKFNLRNGKPKSHSSMFSQRKSRQKEVCPRITEWLQFILLFHRKKRKPELELQMASSCSPSNTET